MIHRSNRYLGVSLIVSLLCAVPIMGAAKPQGDHASVRKRIAKLERKAKRLETDLEKASEKLDGRKASFVREFQKAKNPKTLKALGEKIAAEIALSGPVSANGARLDAVADGIARKPVWINFASLREQNTYLLRRIERFELRPLIMRSD